MLILEGNRFQDERGEIVFSNHFNLSSYQRCYQITPNDPKVIRAWQGHQYEKKAFWVTEGSFVLQWVLINDFNNADTNSVVKTTVLNCNEPKIFLLPPGYANGFQALEKKSSLMVFSDIKVEDSIKDDYRWDTYYFTNAKWN